MSDSINTNSNETFEYTYSPKHQAEVERIKQKYMPVEDDKMTQLRKLDASVTRPGTICSIAMGVIGCLIFGFGMCCTMVWADTLFITGIIAGILGMIVMGLAYPVCKKITANRREKLAPQILALSEELLKQ